jgi:hypothetical protein
MRDTTASLFRWFLVGFVMLLCFMLGIQHGESLGEAKTAEKMMEEVNATAVMESTNLALKLAPVMHCTEGQSLKSLRWSALGCG